MEKRATHQGMPLISRNWENDKYFSPRASKWECSLPTSCQVDDKFQRLSWLLLVPAQDVHLNYAVEKTLAGLALHGDSLSFRHSQGARRLSQCDVPTDTCNQERAIQILK
jgi:hypothetical protein